MTSATETPALPARLSRLRELAYDLWWTWHPAREVFRQLDYKLWRRTDHNPVRMLNQIDPDRLAFVATQREFLALYDAAIGALDTARDAKGTWWAERVGSAPDEVIAYFSAEFALHQSLPIYAGGLGVLAGDHCKEASDLGVPLVGVGFMYPQGYFRQRLTPDGWQEEVDEQLAWTDAPILLAKSLDGKPCVVMVPLGGRTVLVQVWKVQLGRVKLFLLDTNLEQNAPEDRALSARLYGGDHETRLRQEVVLGLGGVLALGALGITPTAWHLNEGHAAFVVLQRTRDLLASGLDWNAAMAEVKRTTIFTTHTPVPAGHDAFPFDLIERQLAGCWGSLGDQRDQFIALGDYDNGSGHGRQFNMTALAMRSAGAINAVSQLHGVVTREMFAPLWPDVPAADRPVAAITNGVHVPSWIARDLFALYDRRLGADWRDRYGEEAFWSRLLEIPDAELWGMRETLRQYLFEFIRERCRDRWVGDHHDAMRVLSGGAMLDPAVLTIGFARRFTGYKRPDLVFRDLDRLVRILTNGRRPVQIVFAGKAHPKDDGGKHHLQTVVRHALDPRLAGRIAFVDDYDLHVAHFLVQGCDVWLNTPRKPLEASGTSGMKAAINGTLHCSIGDGWWAEGCTGQNGWLIEGTPRGTSTDDMDAADAEALYTLLEREIVPAFYDRDSRGIPLAWVERIRQSLLTVTPRFSARRMVKDYIEHAYAPAFRKP